MNITKINSISNIQNPVENKVKKSYLQGFSAPDTFEKVSFKGNFDLNFAMSELKSMKGFKDTPKFNDEKLEEIKAELQKTPDKWEPFRNLIKNPKIISSIACDILKKDTEDLKNIVDLASMKKEDNSARFSPFDIKAIGLNLSGEQIVKFKAFANAPLGNDNLIELSKISDLKNTERVVSKSQEMNKLCGEDLLDLKFKVDDYDKNGYSLVANLKDGSKKIELFDKDLKTTSVEEAKILNNANGTQNIVKKTVDYRNNTTSKVTLEQNKKLPQPVLLNEIRIVKDKNGKKIRTEYAEQSDVTGVLNIKHVMPDGSEKIISSASVDKKTGITSVKKDMTSLDGTRTQYLYEDDPQGNRISDYVITDKNGNVLLKNSQSFEVVDDKTYISTKNNEKYEIKVEDNEIKVKDLNKNNTASIKFENIEGNQAKIINVLKKMPGEEIMALSQKTKHLQGIDDIFQSTYGAVNKRIKTADNLFVMLHELGHAKDYDKVDVKQVETLKKSIYSNPKINTIFEKEKAQFNKAFPNAQREHINYFIKTSDVGDGIQEAIAESNAMLNTYNNDDLFSVRSQYLQQYFPKTIAELSKILNK